MPKDKKQKMLDATIKAVNAMKPSDSWWRKARY